MSYNGPTTLENVVISVQTPVPFYAKQSRIEISSLSMFAYAKVNCFEEGGATKTPTIIPLVIACPKKTMFIPTSLQVQVSVLYQTIQETTGMHDSRNASITFNVPLSLAGSVVSPKKAQAHKITIETNLPPYSLVELFSDLSSGPESQHMTAGLMTFQYCHGDDVTILVSKNAGKYRLQSNSLDTLFLLGKEIAQRIKLRNVTKEVQITFTEPLPFDPYFAVIAEHFDVWRFVLY